LAELAATARVRNTLGALEEGEAMGGGPPVQADFTAHRFHIGHIHNITVATLGGDVSGTFWHRRIRTTGLQGIA
jgi:hypothetical protein